MDGHWLMDQLDPQRYQTLVHLVPPPARLIIVKGFARRYRRACAIRWGSDVTVTPRAAQPCLGGDYPLLVPGPAGFPLMVGDGTCNGDSSSQA
jgi:hypothetical protein